MKIDAHCHTDCSDGNLTIEARIQMVRDCGYQAATITDHDYVSPELVDRARAACGPMPFIPGIELSLQEGGKVIHLLGYYIDPSFPALQHHIQKVQDTDREITAQLLEASRPLGAAFSLADLVSPSPHTFYSLQYVKRVAREFFDNSGQRMMPFFQSLIRELGLTYADFAPWPVRDALDLIHAAGGIAVLAHPGGADDAVMQALGFCLVDESLLRSYLDWGLDGIETAHPCHNPQETRHFASLADKYHLLKTAGSDCHGDDPYLGPRTMGVFTDIPDDLYEELERAYHAKQ